MALQINRLRGQRMRPDELIEDVKNDVQQYIPVKINEQREAASSNIQMPKQSIYLFRVDNPFDRQDCMIFLLACANDTDIPLTMGNAMTIFANLFLLASGQPPESLIQVLTVNFDVIRGIDNMDWLMLIYGDGFQGQLAEINAKCEETGQEKVPVIKTLFGIMTNLISKNLYSRNYTSWMISRVKSYSNAAL